MIRNRDGRSKEGGRRGRGKDEDGGRITEKRGRRKRRSGLLSQRLLLPSSRQQTESLPLKVPLDGKSPVQVSSTAGLTLASLSPATLAAGNDFFILQVQGLNGLSSLDFLQETKTEPSGAEIKGGAHLLWPPNAGARVRNPFPQRSHQCGATGARSGRHTGKPLHVLKDSLFNIFFF